jgi:hypothetical protein
MREGLGLLIGCTQQYRAGALRKNLQANLTDRIGIITTLQRSPTAWAQVWLSQATCLGNYNFDVTASILDSNGRLILRKKLYQMA